MINYEKCWHKLKDKIRDYQDGENGNYVKGLSESRSAILVTMIIIETKHNKP